MKRCHDYDGGNRLETGEPIVLISSGISTHGAWQPAAPTL